ncbi:DEAD/DEAH box helicase [Alteribacter aurantiacus]|uniref:DEAD/DEAH box helicase n=1 Tax=Alteribacter aurantiacus TaxID=254410 RepID=UPI0003F602B3|nr:DEAD/DEAH box helicase family protein [Alteribacter aurantiacus]
MDELLEHTDLLTIHLHVLNGHLRYEPALTIIPKLQCTRCGNRDPELFYTYDCFRCKQPCTYCRSCIMMGRSGSCAVFVTATTAFSPQQNPHTLAWKGTLSPAQQQASTFLVNQINSEVKECLLWAVCGAGKTEMLFDAIHHSLNDNKRVLIATPRADVVRELVPRLNAAFPGTDIAMLFGGSDDRFKNASLTVSTTHQLLRFYHAFDLTIIDEVDAFPYDHDPKLRYAVKQATKPDALVAYVTATPDQRMQSKAIGGMLPHVKVPRRFHGHPLPEPTFQWAMSWRKTASKGRLPSAVEYWLKTVLLEKKQVFLFVPSIRILRAILPYVQERFPNTAGVYSEDDERREKVKAFREGKTRLLLTTTILERGVTVKGVQVGVLGADDGVFTESALVQMAGRVGRSPDEHGGQVVFFHDGKTRAMVEARNHIRMMNREKVEE